MGEREEGRKGEKKEREGKKEGRVTMVYFVVLP